MLFAQSGIGLGLLGMSFCDSRPALGWLVALAVVVAFFSATQDIALDAFRIESTDESLQGATAATYQLGYRIAVLVASAGVLYIAEFASWPIGYATMALLALVGIATTLMVSEAEVRGATSDREHEVAEFVGRYSELPLSARNTLGWIYGAVVCPFVDFFARFRGLALAFLAFIGLFYLSDTAMGVMANPFYESLGFTKGQIASISKVYGFAMTILGILLGGVLVFRAGAVRLLAPSVFLMAASNLAFSWLAVVGRPDPLLLTIAISIDNFVAGAAGTVFIAFLSGLTNTAYTATQYALFSSIMTLPGRLLGGFSGLIVIHLQASGRDVPAVAIVLDAVLAAPQFEGYALFFAYSALLGLPALVFAMVVRRSFGSGITEARAVA